MWAGLQLNQVNNHQYHQCQNVDSNSTLKDRDSQEEVNETGNQENDPESNVSKKGTKRKKIIKKPAYKKKLEEFKMWFTLPKKDEIEKDPIRKITCTFPMEQIRSVSRIS